ncbi:DUF2235 domain-containing protein [Roseovarius sp. D22-M7]|uniref:DUF2235 domain-containing protein n=1 Tax=Roseovarius sp. D22-M7 TaxID=3127116 RepID=UPI00300FCE9E
MRNLVVAADGTWSKPDQMDRGRNVPTNVVKFVRAIDEDNEDPKQLKYYDTGVGTDQWWNKFRGGIAGRGLFKNMRDAYAWILRHHRPEDRLYLVGFSRGAFTVRSLAGMLGLCGIPDRPDDADTLAIEAARIYRDPDESARRDRAAAFRQAHDCKPGAVHFIGVWDTVGALGLPTLGPIGDFFRRQHSFHDVSLGANVRHAFHAVAIHERRAPFEPTLWRGEKSEATESVVQAWFPGVHNNIGGGYADAGLSDRALDWMIAHAQTTGLVFNQDYLARRIDPNWFGEIRDSMTFIYRTPLTGLPRDRKIGAGGLNERLHVSTKRRYASPSRPDAPPANLEGVDLPVDDTML